MGGPKDKVSMIIIELVEYQQNIINSNWKAHLSSRVYRKFKPLTTNYKKTTDHRAVPEQAGSFP